MVETRILGPEYDTTLLAALKAVLRRLGAKLVRKDWDVAGSQEVSTADFMVRGEPLHVETETYVGLSISGSSALLSEVADALRSECAARKRR